MTTENKLYFPALDGWRALAMGAVFCAHYLQQPWGGAGVDLFFALSGFLITGILLDSRNRTDRYRAFYLRRTLRIFPLYYGVLLVVGLWATLSGMHWTWPWLGWPIYLGNFVRFLHPFSTNPDFFHAAYAQPAVYAITPAFLYLGHFWSLCIEEQFYLIWPWLVYSLKSARRLLVFSLVYVAVMPIVRWAVLQQLGPRWQTINLSNGFTLLRSDSLVIGGLLAIAIRSSWGPRVLRGCRWLLWAYVVILSTAAYLHHFSGQFPAIQTWGVTALDVFVVCIVASALHPGTLAYRVGTVRWLRWLGTISYGLYVFHDIPHLLYARAANHLGRNNVFLAQHQRNLTALIAIPATILIAWLSYRYFETPFLRLKDVLAPADRSKPSLNLDRIGTPSTQSIR